MAQHQRGRGQQLGVPVELLQRPGGHLAAQELPLGVERLHPVDDGPRPVGVGGGEELHGDLGVGQAAQGIEARRQGETDVLLVEGGGRDAGPDHQRLQAGAGGGAQGGQAALEQVAHVAGLLGHVGHQAQGHQVQPAPAVVASGRLQAAQGQQVGGAHAGEPGQGMAAGQEARRDDGPGRRQGLGGQVVVADHRVHAPGGGPLDGLVGGDAGVAGDEQPEAAGRPAPCSVGRCTPWPSRSRWGMCAQATLAPRAASASTITVVAVTPSTSKSPQTPTGSPAATAARIRSTAAGDAGQVGRRAGRVAVGVQKGQGGLGRQDAASRQGGGDQGVASHGLGQGGGHGHGFRLGPGDGWGEQS